MLNAYFSRTTEPILAEGGMVNKFIGDAVMAIFGSPVRYPDHARRALRAAVQMAKEAEEFKSWMLERFPDRGLPEFGIGIGVHSGEAVIGDIGSVKRTEFTAIGDTVNTSSRLESLNKDFGTDIIVSGIVADATRNEYVWRFLANQEIRGRSEPLPIYTLIDRHEEVSKLTGREGNA